MPSTGQPMLHAGFPRKTLSRVVHEDRCPGPGEYKVDVSRKGPYAGCGINKSERFPKIEESRLAVTRRSPGPIYLPNDDLPKKSFNRSQTISKSRRWSHDELDATGTLKSSAKTASDDPNVIPGSASDPNGDTLPPPASLRHPHKSTPGPDSYTPVARTKVNNMASVPFRLPVHCRAMRPVPASLAATKAEHPCNLPRPPGRGRVHGGKFDPGAQKCFFGGGPIRTQATVERDDSAPGPGSYTPGGPAKNVPSVNFTLMSHRRSIECKEGVSPLAYSPSLDLTHSRTPRAIVYLTGS
ncbi:hypothetical protein DIPPA_34293 [Diplonema papillatum]|nr:hypothetical protein DIPPA_34293 [Diplonema papillatum]|eukprot:gene9732-15108_t